MMTDQDAVVSALMAFELMKAAAGILLLVFMVVVYALLWLIAEIDSAVSFLMLIFIATCAIVFLT